MRHGAFDYLTKPFDLSQVLMAVDRALRYQVLNVPESEWREIRESAESEDYSEQMIDRRELRSFIVSIKPNHGFTGPRLSPLRAQRARAANLSATLANGRRIFPSPLGVRYSLRRRDSLTRVHKRNATIPNLLIQVRHCLIDQFVQLSNKHVQLACQPS